jgi:hypothetical protein
LYSKPTNQLENVLVRFIPKPAVALACEMLRQHPHHITITPPRATKLGDFTVKPNREKHEITVNGDLNKYAFLITLMHELAHLITYNQFKNQVKPHGPEWKDNFKRTLGPFLEIHVFPELVQKAIYQYLQNPDASTCTDLHLSAVLSLYDKNESGEILLEHLKDGERFYYGKEKRIFLRIRKNRTRILCREEASGHEFLFSAVSKIIKWSN